MPSYPPREFERRLVAQSTMRTNATVIVPPSFCHGLCFIERKEPMLVQALDTKSTIERLDERIIRGLSWPAEVELHAVEVRPQIQAPRDDSHGSGYRLTSAAGIAVRPPADRTRSPCSNCHSFCPVGGRASRTWTAFRRRGFRRLIPRPSSQYSRYTSFLFTSHPSRRRRTQSRGYP